MGKTCCAVIPTLVLQCFEPMTPNRQEDKAIRHFSIDLQKYFQVNGGECIEGSGLA